MNVNIQTVHFDADVKLVEHVNRKIAKLEIFHDRITKVDVYLKLDNVVHTIKDKVAEIRVRIPRHEFFVKQTSKSFEESFDGALDSMINQLKKVKENWLKNRQEQIKTNEFWMTIFTNAKEENENLMHVFTFNKRVKQLQATELLEAAKIYLNAENYIQVVMYPEHMKPTDGVGNL